MPPTGGPTDPLAAYAAARHADLWETTLALLERGKAEDDAGAASAAALLYSEAIGGLEALLELEPEGRRRELLRERLAEYGARLPELHAISARQVAAVQVTEQAAAAAAAPANAAEDSQGAAAREPRPALRIESSAAARATSAPLASARLQTELAVQADAASDWGEALVLYTSAAEHLLAALRLEEDAGGAPIRQRLAAVMDRAEQIKAGKAEPRVSTSRPAADAAGGADSAASASRLSEEEKRVLARSSRIGALLHYPWLGGDHARERFSGFASAWTDPDGLLTLNREQKQHFARWGRPSEFMRSEPRMIFLVSPLSITQTVITDCSFVSSLVIAAAYERKFRRQLITALIHPQDRSGAPIYNPAGKYLVRLKFNGVDRRILIDDRLPLDARGRPLCSHSVHAEELWIALIEKAYMKVNGGYDFPGSNSGIDMHALTGWIPEQLRTDEPDFKRERLWERMTSAARYGDCLVTVATGEMGETQADALGLVPTHAYAVLAVRQASSGARLLQLKNPWARVRWKGAYSELDAARWTPALRKELGFDRQGALQQDNGIFWIDYKSLLRHFKGVFLNWNPALFRHHTLAHGQWTHADVFRDDVLSLGTNPQYSLTVNVPAVGATTAVWLLLTRHQATPYNLSRAAEEAFLTVHVFDASGRAYYLERCWLQGVYSNRPHTLVKLDLPPAATPKTLTLALAQFKPSAKPVDYTLDVYAQAHFALRRMAPAPPPSARAAGAWRGASAGGSPNHDSHADNPRLLLELPAAADVFLELECTGRGHAEVQVGFVLSRHGAAAPASSSSADGSTALPLRSGDYRPGFCRREVSLPAGKYVLVPSAFLPGTESGFEVRAGAGGVRCSLTPLAGEAAGLARQTIRGAWEAASAAGSPNHGAFWRNPQLRLTLTRGAELLLRLRAPVAQGAAPALCVALFDGPERRDQATGKGLAAARAVSEGGVYAHPPGGACLPRMWLEPGSYVCVLSTFNPHVGAWELSVHSTEGAVQVAAFR